ncbi:EF-hand domain-containing protein [Pelagibius sp.]|uniref:EF-hand domain-containing protein n=1 Tax=Pelagibius sp. TaxID=1931238 RepID=UPI003BB01990
MNKTTKIAIAAVVVLGVGAAAVAAQADGRWRGHGGSSHCSQGYGGGPGMGGHGGRMATMLRYFDSDGDGAVSQAEIDQVRDERFAAFDGDQSQSLSLAEFEGLWLDFMRERMVDGFQRLDADGDGQVTLAEVNRPLGQMVQRMDRNEDGVIDRSDFKRGKGRDRDVDEDSDS